MIRHETSIAIARPPAEVIEFVARMDRQTDYWESVRSVRLLSGAPGQAGSRYERVIDAMGKIRRTEVEVVENRPGERVVFQSLTPPIRVRATMDAERTQGGTRLRLLLEGRAEGAIRLLRPLLKRRFARLGRASLERLRDILESRNTVV